VCADDDAGDTESALQSSTRSKGLGKTSPNFRIETLERRDRTTCDLGEIGLATDDGLSVDENRATSALTARRAPVLRRSDVELFSECGEEVGVGASHGDGHTIDDEVHSLLRDPRRHGFTLQGKEKGFTVC
jgi:hypothetical protein